MKGNIINNISDSKDKDKTKKNCLKEEFSKLKEFHGIEILDCIKLYFLIIKLLHYNFRNNFFTHKNGIY